MSLYQLPGRKNLKRGDLVDMGPGNERYGIIQGVIKEDYSLPNPCVVSGSIKYFPKPLSLYLISGTPNKMKNPPVGYVWSFS